MARTRKRPSSVQNFKDAFTETGLPTPELVEKAAAELTEEPKKEEPAPKKSKPATKARKAKARR